MKKLKITSIPSPQIISPGEWVIKEGDKAGVNIAAKEYIRRVLIHGLMSTHTLSGRLQKPQLS